MKTVVLPVCEKCGKPIEPEACILVDGALFSIYKHKDDLYKADTALVEHFTASGAYHAACLTSIINNYAIKGSLQKMNDAIKKLKAAGNVFDGINEAKPGADQTVTTTPVPKNSWGWMDVTDMRRAGKDKPSAKFETCMTMDPLEWWDGV
jgi:hypothetical protein